MAPAVMILFDPVNRCMMDGCGKRGVWPVDNSGKRYCDAVENNRAHLCDPKKRAFFLWKTPSVELKITNIHADWAEKVRKE